MSNALIELKLGLYMHKATSPTAAALLKVERFGVMESGTLSYGRQFINNQNMRFHPDPALAKPVNLLSPQRMRDGGALPPYLKDALPDSWGRLVLMAANPGITPDDYVVLSMTNEYRIGAVVVMDSPYLPSTQPPLSLQDLYTMAMAVQYGRDVPLDVRRLLTQGGSLGGARPKASIYDDGALWLAKFPLREDAFDYQIAEAGTLQLAAMCGIQASTAQCVVLHHATVLMTKRFDRIPSPDGEQRIHFLSAAGLLNVDYESGQGTYVELAHAISRFGAAPKEDCRELFRRMIFNMLIDNTDDHVKNHGFLHTGDNKYRLAPAYDIHPQGTHLQYMGMPLVNDLTTPSIRQIVDEAHHFHLNTFEAELIILQLITKISGNWRKVFTQAGMTDQDIQYLAKVLNPLHERWQAMHAEFIATPVQKILGKGEQGS